MIQQKSWNIEVKYKTSYLKTGIKNTEKRLKLIYIICNNHGVPILQMLNRTKPYF